MNEQQSATASGRNASQRGFLIAILALGLGARLLAWTLQPGDEFGRSGDEVSYYRAGLMLEMDGKQDLFWPPLSGWVVAGLANVLQTERITTFRFAWCLFGTLSVWLVWLLARRFQAAAPRDNPLPWHYPVWAGLFWAIYLPAIGYSTHVTSEMLSVVLLLSATLILGLPSPVLPWRAAVAGICLGFCILARGNLAPVLPALALTLFLLKRSRQGAWRLAAVSLIVCGVLVPSLWVARNYVVTGKAFLSLNYVSNLKRGSRNDLSAKLDLLDASPSERQIARRSELTKYHSKLSAGLKASDKAVTREERRRVLKEYIPFPEYDPDLYFKVNEGAVGDISARPFQYAWEAVGKVARMFVPRTMVRDLVSPDKTLADPIKLSLFILANIQWVILLLGSLVGFLSPGALSKTVRLILLAIIAGSAVCSIAGSSEPRYSFPFEFAMLMSAVAFYLNPKRHFLALLQNRMALVLCAALSLFLCWAWAMAGLWALSPGMSSQW